MSWLESNFPEPINLLGQRLESLTLGHCMILERLKNPFFVSGTATVDHLFECVYVCCQPCKDSWNSFFDEKFPEKIKVWRKKIGKHDFEKSMKVFEEYKEKSTLFPDVGGGVDDVKRKLGTPYLLQLKLSLQSKLFYSEEEALNKPISVAVWEVIGLLEMQGEAKILNDTEREILNIHKEMLEKEEK